MSGLIPPAILSLTTTSLKKLKAKNDAELSYFFLYGYNKKGGDEEAYLQVKKSKIARADFKELKAAIRASYRNTVIMGTVFYHDDKKTFEFRSPKAPRAQKSWKRAKKTAQLKLVRGKVNGFADSYLSTGAEEASILDEFEPSFVEKMQDLFARCFGLEAEFDEEAYDDTLDADLEEEDFADEDFAVEGIKTTYENSVSAISTFILYQQNMLRNKKGQVDGILNFQELSISDPDGNPIWLSEDFLQETSLSRCFFVNKSGELQLKKQFLNLESVSQTSRFQVAHAIHGLLDDGFSVHLSHEGNTLDLAQKGGEVFEKVHHEQWDGSLNFSRLDESMLGSEPPISFREGMKILQSSTDAAEVERVHALFVSSYQKEQEAGLISPDMEFLDYKLQFASLDVPQVLENGLRWHDGDGQLNLAEWAGLRMRVADLPKEEQFYHWVKIEWESDGKTEKVSRRIALPKMFSSQEEAIPAIKKELEKEEWYTEKLNITLNRYDYSLPSKTELLPKLNAWSEQQVSALVRDERGDLPDEIPSASDFAQQAENIALMSSMKQCQQNLGESISALISGIPDTQKIFLRQSNGTDNSDRVAGEDVGQTDIIRLGNDTGAFGKCAPTSYYCGVICGIAKGCQDGFDALKDDDDTREVAFELEELYTKVPQQEEDVERMKQILQELSSTCKFNRRKRYLLPSLEKVEKLKETIIDRLQPKMDEDGPYFEMNFALPKIKDSYGSTLRPGVYNTKVRPSDIQEYLEQTNRADEYRGGRKHMMDHFKDPSAMSHLDFLKDLGPGLIAVGVDKTLKAAGKESGLLYGPGPKVVASMVNNERCKVGYLELKDPIEHEVDSDEFKKEKKKRNSKLLSMLKKCKKSGGGVALSMGYNEGNGHVNYLQDWGTPKIAGVEINSLDLARCHMNQKEVASSSSAWNNDRIQSHKMDVQKMTEGLRSIASQLREAGRDDAADKVEKLADKAYMTPMNDLDALRAVSSDVMAWMKESLTLDSDEPNKYNVTLMPSNTERDDALSDNAQDRELVGGGSIGSQKEGSANATDASYFVPLECLAAGWNGKDGDASGYAGFPPEDQFVMLSSIESMY